MRTVFLGSPPFALPTLSALCAGKHRPIAVVTPPDRPRGRGRSVEPSAVAELARELGIALLRPETARDPDFLDELRSLEPELCLVASYGELLTQEFLDIPTRGTLNVHGSLLPRHRGASPVQAAILAGDTTTGVTIQRVVLALDAGDVVHRVETEIGPAETGGELFDRLAELGARAAVEALDAIEAGTAVFEPQDESRVTVCRKLKKEQGRIDWEEDAEAIERRVRAMNPWPGAFTTLTENDRLYVHRAREERELRGEPGVVLEAGPRLVVGTGDAALELLEVQRAGKRALEAEEFLRGARMEVGNRLGGRR